MLELRCPNKKFGEVAVASLDEGIIEVMCPSRFCGKRGGVVVLHRFSTSTGKLLATRRYKSPEGGKQE